MNIIAMEVFLTNQVASFPTTLPGNELNWMAEALEFRA